MLEFLSEQLSEWLPPPVSTKRKRLPPSPRKKSSAMRRKRKKTEGKLFFSRHFFKRRIWPFKSETRSRFSFFFSFQARKSSSSLGRNPPMDISNYVRLHDLEPEQAWIRQGCHGVTTPCSSDASQGGKGSATATPQPSPTLLPR